MVPRSVEICVPNRSFIQQMFPQSYAEARQGTSLHLEVTSPYPRNTNGWLPEAECKLSGSLLSWAVEMDSGKGRKEGVLSPQLSVLSLGGSTNTGLLSPSRNLGLEKFPRGQSGLVNSSSFGGDKGKFESHICP